MLIVTFNVANCNQQLDMNDSRIKDIHMSASYFFGNVSDILFQEKPYPCTPKSHDILTDAEKNHICCVRFLFDWLPDDNIYSNMCLDIHDYCFSNYVGDNYHISAILCAMIPFENTTDIDPPHPSNFSPYVQAIKFLSKSRDCDEIVETLDNACFHYRKNYIWHIYIVYLLYTALVNISIVPKVKINNLFIYKESKRLEMYLDYEEARRIGSFFLPRDEKMYFTRQELFLCYIMTDQINKFSKLIKKK